MYIIFGMRNDIVRPALQYEIILLGQNVMYFSW
jgi:hypothetical protein